ncbi:MAG: DNA recombination protein RmuC [Pseudomonadota bacterium]
MITIGTTVIDFNDPTTQLIAAGAVVALILLILMVVSLRTARSSAQSLDPLARSMAEMSRTVASLGAAQHQLTGSLQAVSEAQAVTQSQVVQTMERRLEEVQRAMGESLHGTATRTARSLGELHTRLETIDKAQTKIEKLSGDVLSLQDILSNKQTRGAFGEIQLNDIVSKALPPDAFAFQTTLSNGTRADCIIHLPNPPGSIVIDSKFPLEAYEAMHRAETEHALKAAVSLMRTSIRKHIKDISEKYIIDGETADGALMFLPSEAVYAELHATFPEIVREGFDARVWIVSPTTCMATLNTMRAILKDARMREQAGAIRRELALLYKDVDRLGDRVGNLDRHFVQASKDIEDIKISATKAGSRARRLDSFDFDDAASEDSAAIVRLKP